MTKQTDVAPVKLKELDPQWITEDSDAKHVVGVTFACPHCRTARIGIPFYVRGARAIAEANAAEGAAELLRGKRNSDDSIWDVRGPANSFDYLSLAPKIEVEGHWSGAVTNGEVTTDKIAPPAKKRTAA